MIASAPRPTPAPGAPVWVAVDNPDAEPEGAPATMDVAAEVLAADNGHVTVRIHDNGQVMTVPAAAVAPASAAAPPVVPAAVGEVHLTAVNSTSGQRVDVLRCMGRLWSLGPVRNVKATVVGLDGARFRVELDADVTGITRAWCTCGSDNPRHHHATAAYRRAGGSNRPAGATAVAESLAKERGRDGWRA